MKIVFVGLAGVPYAGRACDSRLANMANLLAEKASVEILNRYSSIRDDVLSGIKLSDDVLCDEIIKPRKTSGIATFLFYVLSLLIEPFSILESHKREKVDWLHLYTGHYIDFVIYRVIAKLIGAKIVYEYVEYRSEKPAYGLYHKINNYLCDIEDKRIKFLGTLPRTEVLKIQKEAFLLINPRHSSEEFTKYSFPSKTMEYLASGTPTLMCQLKCIPNEYKQFLFFIEDETVEGYKNAILNIIKTDPNILETHGLNARKFILEQKNPYHQVSRVLEFLKTSIS